MVWCHGLCLSQNRKSPLAGEKEQMKRGKKKKRNDHEVCRIDKGEAPPLR